MSQLEPTILTIRHVAGSTLPSFFVQRLPDGKASPATKVPSPYGYPVRGMLTSDLMGELRWYLERFLDYPYSPETERADRVLDTLRKWGTEAFEALFGSRSAGRFFDAATEKDYARLNLRIVSDDPVVLSWPWEALCDPEADFLAHTCQVERRLDNVRDPIPLSDKLSRDRVNILIITARPYEGDVRYRSIARPLVDLVAAKNLPVHVEVLRPPTFDQLLEHLRERPAHYHIVHFDGHGAYRDDALPSPGGHTLAAREGRLVFEKTDGTPDPISAQQLSALLREHAVPVVVLSACQSAMLDQDARDPFASVAAALLKAGVRSVVAMAWSLYVSGARQFLPAFYERLFAEGSVVRAVRAGRQQMLAQPERVCARGDYPLQDWCVPVLYQQAPLDFAFAARTPPVESISALPEEVEAAQGPHGVVGRDGAMLAIERAMRRPPAAVVVTGLGGVGKTTLAAGFLAWLRATGGLGEGALWFSFADIRSAEFVINRMGEAVVGSSFAAADLETRLRELTRALRGKRFVIVWDNFESVRGILGTHVTANLGESDQALLTRLLEGLRGGASKVLITSRTSEDWLGHERRFVLPLGGLDGEERWEYCDLLLRDLGLVVKREDPELVALMDLLGGHPLAMRVVLPRLASMIAVQVLAAVRSNLNALPAGADAIEARFHATLRMAIDALPADLAPLLVPLALHEGFVLRELLERMAKVVDVAWRVARVGDFLRALSTAGLLRDLDGAVYEMHPALTGYLRSALLPSVLAGTRDAWARAFVGTLGSVADALTPRHLHEQSGPFRILGASFHQALGEARSLDRKEDVTTLTQSLAAYALNTGDHATAEALFKRLEEHARASMNEEGVAVALSQLGRIALERREFATAESHYLEALAIAEKQGDTQLVAGIYHQLGMATQNRRDFAVAESWYLKSLAVQERQGDEQATANSYHQLGRIAQEREALTLADSWYRKALAIREKHGDEHGAAVSYQQLGIVAHRLRDFAAAESWYLKSLAVKERQGNERGAANSYHQLGRIAQDRGDFAVAESWYLKSLVVKEGQGDERGAAFTYGQLGVLAGLAGRFEDSGRWLIRCVLAFMAVKDPHNATRNSWNFASIYANAPAELQAKLARLWNEAGLGSLPQLPPT